MSVIVWQIRHEGMQRNARLVEASNSRLPSPPPTPPLVSSLRSPSLPPNMVVEPSSEGFDIAFQR
jgi:hypothetical protein